jgi:hypothetical protein
MNMVMVTFWVLTPCGLAGGYQCFGGTYYLPEDRCNMFLRNVGTRPRGVTNQKTNIDIFTAVRTSNLIQ